VGGIAYHYVGDTYAALFTEFITCGVWEGVYLFNLFYRSKAVVHPDNLHAATQGQSTVIFALAYLLGVELMPRIRNWQDLILFRPDKSAVNRHIDALFGDLIDWALIEHQWQDFMQIPISIEQRRVLPSTLLRRLSVKSRKNRLCQAFRELGRVIRTIFLLCYISDPLLRRGILKMTNKVEPYHHFRDWVGFGSEGVITHNDPIEQEKRVKYNDLIANAQMVQNVVDMTRLLRQFGGQGYLLTPEILGVFSPYLTRHIKRFGECVVRLDQEPKRWRGIPGFFP
jgi:TnpA family transposase